MVMGLGYAFLTTNLNIEGTADIDANTWNVYWNNIVVNPESVTAEEPVINSDKTSVTYSVHLSKPGDFYEFTVDAVNDGSIDAMINVIEKSVNGNASIPKYLDYSITYGDDIPVLEKQKLNSLSRESYKVRVEYSTEIEKNDLPSTNQSLTLSFGATYVQSDRSAIRVLHPNDFATDDWDTIAFAVRNNSTSKYHVGDTKTIDLGELGTHTLRIANMSSPPECNDANFSQTACGFVIEFADVINRKSLNSSNSTQGGWENCTMRTYYIDTLYLTSFPDELKNNLVDTYVVSGPSMHSENTNYTTTDKLYPLSAVEIWGSSEYDNVTSTETRQLDYYRDLNVSQTDNNSAAIKQYNGTNTEWWLRSVTTSEISYEYSIKYLTVSTDGNESGNFCHVLSGVSFAFRIG